MLIDHKIMLKVSRFVTSHLKFPVKILLNLEKENLVFRQS